MTSHIGSVFLGDVQRQRVFSSTPPSSPPAYVSPNAMSSFQDIDDADIDIINEGSAQSSPPRESTTASASISASASTSGDVSSSVDDSADAIPVPVLAATTVVSAPPQPPPLPPPSVPPVLSLDLRLRWLETLLYGTKGDGKPAEVKKNETLARRAEELQRKLYSIVQSNDGLKKFVEHYDQHAHLLTPSFALSGTLSTGPPTYENMSSAELEAFLAEMEPDIRAAERDLREIATLEEKGVTGAGKLAEYKTMQPRLETLLKAHEEDLKKAAELEGRIAKVMERYATQVDTLSELFVAWDDTLKDAEDHVHKFAKEKGERRRLGYE